MAEPAVASSKPSAPTSKGPPPSGDAKVGDDFTPRTSHSVVPQGSIAGRSLTLVIAIMAFLASLTLGAVSLVSDTARSWQSDIAREITVQVRPVAGASADMEQRVLLARQIAGGTPGIASVSVVDDEATRRLLEPWLGSGMVLDELPVPRLLRLSINRASPPDLSALAAELADAVPGASLDDHRSWQGRLATMARATVLAGGVIFLLMLAATVLTVIFATRGAMAGNRHTIDVLHFVGAERNYIAAQFQRHFLWLGLKGGLAGGVVAIAVFVALGLWSGRDVADPVADQAFALFGTFAVGWTGYTGVVALVFAVAVLTALTSRYTVLAQVGDLDGSRQT